METAPNALIVPTVHGTTFMVKMPTYEGRDPCFQEEPWCVHCHSRPASGLLCCSRCRTAWYCNNDCQKSHYKAGHKTICLEVARDLKAVEREAVRLRNFRFQNLFETHVTNFSEVQETKEYMTALKEVWEKVLFHSLALLRLEMFDVMEMRYVTPFILLGLQRDDDAFAFIRYFISLDYLGDEAMDDLQGRYVQCQEGDWVYPREENCRYLDIFQGCSAMTEDCMPTAFLVAVLVIKFRLVAAYDAARRSIDIASETTGGQTIQKVQQVVNDMLINESLVNIENQRQQIERLINVIHRINPSMLPSILNPNPLLRQHRPPLSTPGEPSEALHILVYCIRPLVRIPGATEKLEQRFGKMPSYNSFL